MILRSIIAALLGLAVLGGSVAAAQDWPTKPVRIITGFAAGGIGDLGARLLAEHIGRTTGQQAVVENRTGAAGTLATDAVAKSQPDGHTLGLILNGNLVINPFVQRAMPFDPLKDIIPVAAIGEAPQIMALSTEVPAKTFKEFQALAKAKPKTFVYGSAGLGSLPHLAAAEFAHQAGIELVHVPYRGRDKLHKSQKNRCFSHAVSSWCPKQQQRPIDGENRLAA
jgi:tripartite-type tricarboxylate transporter receptor subunit TctC